MSNDVLADETCRRSDSVSVTEVALLGFQLCELGFKSSREVRPEFWPGMLLRSWSVNLLGVTKWGERVGEGGIESASDSGGR
jgi:hypothetical protein